MRIKSWQFLWLLVIFFGQLVLLLPAPAGGQTFSVLHQFTGGTTDGAKPSDSLIASGNMLYGMTPAGGTQSLGTIYGFNTATNTQTVLHSFAGGTADGSGRVIGTPLLSGNLLYGMTIAGGATNWGVLFALDTTTNTENVIHSFAAPPADGEPNYIGSVLKSGNLLYGMSSGGNPGGGNAFGAIFAFDTSTNTQNLLYSFTGTNGDGASPFGSVAPSGNTLYGFTTGGGTQGAFGGDGTIFAFNTLTNTETVLHSFAGAGADGVFPLGTPLVSGNIIYGMTNGGVHPAPNNGSTLFAFNTATNTQTVLHTFTGGLNNSLNPSGSLIQSGSVLYGMTAQGGTFGDGMIYSFDTSDNVFSILHSFSGADGNGPNGTLSMEGNTLYGVTTGGGIGSGSGNGVIFSLTVPEPATATLLLLTAPLLLGRRRRPLSPIGKM
jgi:uncharacterized repeat protein (TIGR03803 family)